MRLSVNMVIQILMTLLQAYNAVSDMLPDDWKGGAAAIMAIIQAVVAAIAHFKNPDGSSAKVAYIPPPKTPRVNTLLFSIFFLAALVPLAGAQDSSQGFSLGVAYNQNGDPQFAGWGTYDKHLGAGLYSYSGYDVLPLKQDGSKFPQLKFTPFTGFAYRAAKLDRLSLFAFGAGGISTTGEVVTGAGKYGGFGHYDLGKGWGLVAGAEGSYSPINGTDAIIRFGFRYGVK
ncbi:MAG: hypothetical protein JXA73_08870 [Acidobacteria bacterium]|nr:hypothetical protein [Acidobacteriota bacterium]